MASVNNRALSTRVCHFNNSGTSPSFVHLSSSYYYVFLVWFECGMKYHREVVSNQFHLLVMFWSGNFVKMRIKRAGIYAAQLHRIRRRMASKVPSRSSLSLAMDCGTPHSTRELYDYSRSSEENYSTTGHDYFGEFSNFRAALDYNYHRYNWRDVNFRLEFTSIVTIQKLSWITAARAGWNCAPIFRFFNNNVCYMFVRCIIRVGYFFFTSDLASNGGNG